VAASGALASVYQNTIDYNFRDPLTDYVELTRPQPPSYFPTFSHHNYSYNTNTPFWSVVAIRSGGGYGLALFDDFDQTSRLAGVGADFIDFIAVDSHLRPLDDYYPQVRAFSRTDDYQIELAQGANTLFDLETVFMSSKDVVVVRDTFLKAGVPVTFRVEPTNGGQDAEVFLMGPDPVKPVQTPTTAVAQSTTSGPGLTEIFVYTPAAGGYYGVVLLNRVGEGDYKLSRTPPLVTETCPVGCLLPPVGGTAGLLEGPGSPASPGASAGPSVPYAAIASGVAAAALAFAAGGWYVRRRLS